MKYLALIICASGLLWSCQSEQAEVSSEQTEDAIELARVYNKSLYLSDLSTLEDQYESKEDSLEALRTAVNRWVRDELLLHEASKNISEDLNLDQLVEEYRESLIRHHYEQKLIATNLDTVVTEFDLKAHLEENEAHYSLEKSILRCLYIKVRKPVKSIKRIQEWLEKPDSKNLKSMRKYCRDYADYCLSNPDKWYKWEDIKKSFPDDFEERDLRSGTLRTFADFKYQYFIRILEYVSKKDDVPLSFFEEQATKLIIRERKNRLLEDLKMRLYEEQKSSSAVKIYVND